MNVDPTALPVFHALVSGIERTLGSRLRGLYLYGSSTLGDFNPDRTDIDLLAVTDSLVPIDSSGLLAFHDAHRQEYPAWADRIEVGYFSTETLLSFTTARGDVVRIAQVSPSIERLRCRTGSQICTRSSTTAATYWANLRSDPFPASASKSSGRHIQQVVADWTEEVVGVEEERHQAYVRLIMCRGLFAYINGEQA